MPNQENRSRAFEDIPPDDQLPREIPPRFHLNQLVILLMGLLMTVVVVNLLVLSFLGRYTTNFGYFLNYQKWHLLKGMNDPVQWLILGDSSANQGVIPTIVEEELGGRAVNLATNGDMIMINDLWMLDYYIKKFGPPENVLIVHVYDIWHRDFNPVLLGLMPLNWGFWKESSVTDNLVWNREIQRNIFLERYVPIYSLNNTLGSIIKDIFLNFKNPLRSNWTLEPNGYLPAFDPKPEIVVADARDHIQFASENEFDLSDINQESLAKVKQLADEYGINIYIALGPQYEGMAADQNFREYLDTVMEHLSQFDAQSESIHFISDVKAFPANQMQTADHLIDSGAREYTKWLVEHIMMLR